MKNRTGIFIPARLGSQRLPKKHVLPFDNQLTIFEIACRKLDKLSSYTDVYALICDKELIKIASKYNIEIIERSKESSLIDSPMLKVFSDVKYMKNRNLMFLNPCLPFLKISTVLDALDKFNAYEFDYLTSVKPFKNWLFDMDAKPLTRINYKNLSTKDVHGYYEMAHAFHIFNRSGFLESGDMLVKGHKIYSIDSEMECIDIDTQENFEYAKYKFSQLSPEKKMMLYE